MNRTVTVLDPCTLPQGWCTNLGEIKCLQALRQCAKYSRPGFHTTPVGACSKFGVCLPSTSLASNTAPNLRLDTSILGLTIQINQSSTYAACSSGVKPSVAAPCEPGGSATDIQDGSLTASILACPPPSCLSTYCTGDTCLRMQVAPAAVDSGHLSCTGTIASFVHAGQEVSQVGLANCAVNTSLPVGTLISISFLVFDKGTPRLNATAERTLVIGSPCATGKNTILVFMMIVLTFAQQEFAQQPHTLTGLPLRRAGPLQREVLPSTLLSGSVTGAHSLTSCHQHVHCSQSTAGVRVCHQLCLRLCSPTLADTMPLWWAGPCAPSFADSHCHSKEMSVLCCRHAASQANCAVTAYDKQDGDLSAFVTVAPTVRCLDPNSSTCLSCSLAFLQAGQCFPAR